MVIDAATLTAQRQLLHSERAELLGGIEEETLLAMEVSMRGFRVSRGQSAIYDPG